MRSRPGALASNLGTSWAWSWGRWQETKWEDRQGLNTEPVERWFFSPWFLREMNLDIRSDVKLISGKAKGPLGGGTWFGWRQESIWIYGNDDPSGCTGNRKDVASWSHCRQAAPVPACGPLFCREDCLLIHWPKHRLPQRGQCSSEPDHWAQT